MIADILLLITDAAAPAAKPLPQPSGRLPEGHHWGRCLLVVERQTRIDGRCSYLMRSDGSFRIDGPHQLFNGIDYPAVPYAQQISTDYWAEVWSQRGGWQINDNRDPGSPYYQEPTDRFLERQDANCFMGSHVGEDARIETTTDDRVCLWR